MPYSIMESASNERFAADEIKKFAWQRRMNQTLELIWLRFALDGHGEIPMSWYVFWMKQNNLIVSPLAILIVNDKLAELETVPTIINTRQLKFSISSTDVHCLLTKCCCTFFDVNYVLFTNTNFIQHSKWKQKKGFSRWFAAFTVSRRIQM